MDLTAKAIRVEYIMTTKTLTKPKRKQSSQTRSWENLTDRRKLRHIENTLDKAIAQS
jgi:hypothetical protein